MFGSFLKTKHRTATGPNRGTSENLPREIKTFIPPQKKSTHEFIAALLVIAQNRNQPRCPARDEWLNKLWYTHTMEYYSATKRMSY